MARTRRHPEHPDPTGTYDISTGTAEIVADRIRPGSYLLHVNGVPSSHIVPGAPAELEFEYMRWIAAAVEHVVGTRFDPARLRVTHLGGAACSLPRYFADAWPASRHTVVEIDAKLAEYVRSWFDIPRAPTVKIRVGEAREVTESFRPLSRDVVIRDVFAGDATPESLTTTGFYAAAHRSLAPGGLFVANCGDRPPLKGAKAELAGLAEVFGHVAVIADPAMLKNRRYGNIILLASDTALPAAGTPEAADLAKPLLAGAVPAQYKDEEFTRGFFSGTAPRRD